MNLPNKLTLLRILLIPFFMVVLLYPFNWGQVTLLGSVIPSHYLLGALIFAVASFTDWLDGYIARKQGLVTNFGAFADPVADKMLTMTAFIVLVGLNLAPAWVVSLIVMRELAVTGLRLIVVETGGKVMSAALPGKIKTSAQMLSILFLLLDDFPLAWTGLPIGTITLYIALFFTLYSGIDYFWNARHIFKHSM
ncbi:MAG: CDP-diacylglycerol--glycerol-3-phosphate 3-phosphatidyltransferase [Atopococcus tabaci]|uniref:CDP-diacylglycerol--glycerol-3-phosphate 3-phosphatidyltransferase n=1 Tax=Atopococcus tabaci TaxID=269774 RepID=A0AA43UBL8_9LACT|nr:CDP-diacylglycerol--glycerol-3-phosphate 3-phosphatidyltransferase [Atopococcus tabaci]